MNLVRQRPHNSRPRHPALGAASLVVTIGNDTVHATGVLDELTVDLLLAAADFLFTRGSRTVTLDLSGIRSIDSDAVRELFNAQISSNAGTSLHLAVPPHLRTRLAICHLENVPSEVTTAETLTYGHDLSGGSG